MDIPPKLFVTLPPAPPLEMVATKKYIDKPPAPRPEGDDDAGTTPMDLSAYVIGIISGFGIGVIVMGLIIYMATH